MGFVPVYDERLFETCHQFAGNDVHRAAVLQEYLYDDEIDAILCARGGYGTVRIIDNVDFGAFANKPKWIIGYSDVTVLHTKIQSLGYQSIHATMPVNFKENTSLSWQSMMQILTGDNLCYEVGNNELNKKVMLKVSWLEVICRCCILFLALTFSRIQMARYCLLKIWMNIFII